MDDDFRFIVQDGDQVDIWSTTDRSTLDYVRQYLNDNAEIEHLDIMSEGEDDLGEELAGVTLEVTYFDGSSEMFRMHHMECQRHMVQIATVEGDDYYIPVMHARRFRVLDGATKRGFGGS